MVYESPRNKKGAEMVKPKYPEIELRLVGEDGNAYSILGRARRAMKVARLTEEQQKEFMDEATSGDYNNLLSTCIKYFECE